MFIKSYFLIGEVHSQGIPTVTTTLKTKLIETGVRDSCGNTRPRETQQAQKRRGWSARGKSVPAVEINGNGKHKKTVDNSINIE
ncbi:hypothetical protein E2R55_13650 [Vibrio vulnificus]|nr:hypothetical protein E2R55_13650 [Vibrio vulnificus]